MLYLPWAAPGNAGWTSTTATGSRDVGGATPGLELTTTAGQGEVYTFTFASSLDFCVGSASFKVASSGSSATRA